VISHLRALSNGELDSIISRISKATLDIHNTVANAENYMKRVFKSIKKDSSRIRESAERLVSKHIEKIRFNCSNNLFPLFYLMRAPLASNSFRLASSNSGYSLMASTNSITGSKFL
jgi:hypothetical protein